MSGPFQLPDLPYAYDALAPVISSDTVTLHHDKHHAAYYNALNGMLEGTEMAEMTLEEVVVKSGNDASLAKMFNQAGQAWNHIIYWEQMAPGGSNTPSGKLAEMIDREFGSFDDMKAQFVQTAVTTFGAGWAWLAMDGGKLELISSSNAGNPLAMGKTTLCGVDVWEHAYYLDYQNRRPDHVKAVLDSAVNWDYVRERLEEAL